MTQNAKGTAMADIYLPSYVQTAINTLEEHGHAAYAVGGCVRDSLLGRKVNDYDVCTDAQPEETAEIFSSFHVIETGIKHGTVTVRIDHQPIEITTFRLEGDYSDGRHPDSVDFTSDIAADLSRRDFTINAMAYSDRRGLIDPFGGQDDLNHKIIRCVGDPKKRFFEDGLRILRALRFASALSFDIDKETSDAVLDLKDRLSLISRERIRDELLKLLTGDGMSDILLNYMDVITYIIPELLPTIGFNQNNPHHDHDLYEHLVLSASSIKKDPILRLAALLHDVEKPSTASLDDNGISHYYSHAEKSSESAKRIARSLRCSNAEIERISVLIKYHDGVIEETDKAVKRRLNQLGNDGLFDLLDLQRADNLAQKKEKPIERLKHNDNLRDIANRLICENACVRTNTLAINGNEIIRLGYRGRQIGKALSLLLDAVINGEVENEEKALIDFINDKRDVISSVKP